MDDKTTYDLIMAIARDHDVPGWLVSGLRWDQVDLYAGTVELRGLRHLTLDQVEGLRQIRRESGDHYGTFYNFWMEGLSHAEFKAGDDDHEEGDDLGADGK